MIPQKESEQEVNSYTEGIGGSVWDSEKDP